MLEHVQRGRAIIKERADTLLADSSEAASAVAQQ
jgi:hypothetical protein